MLRTKAGRASRGGKREAIERVKTPKVPHQEDPPKGQTTTRTKRTPPKKDASGGIFIIEYTQYYL